MSNDATSKSGGDAPDDGKPNALPGWKRRLFLAITLLLPVLLVGLEIGRAHV